MLEQKIEALTRAVEALTEAIKTASIPTPAPHPEDVSPSDAGLPSQTDQTTAVGVDEQSIKDLTLEMSRSGHRDAIREKLSGFGVKKITDLKGDDATAYYDWLLTLKGDA